MRTTKSAFILLLLAISLIMACLGQINLQTDEITSQIVENLSTYSSATGIVNDISVEYGATNVNVSITGQGSFSGIGQNSDFCTVKAEFYHPGMTPCITSKSYSLTNGGTISAYTTCTIPGPLYYTEYPSISVTATSSRGASSSTSKSFKIYVKQKPPGPNPNPNPNSDSTNWGLILGISIPGAIIFIVLVCCCCRQKKTPEKQKLLAQTKKGQRSR